MALAYETNKILGKFGDERMEFSWLFLICYQQLSRCELFIFSLCLQSAFILTQWLPLVSDQGSQASGS